MSRKTHMFRAPGKKSASITQRNARLAKMADITKSSLERQRALEQSMMLIVKATGSSLKPGEWVLTIPDNPEHYPVQGEKFSIHEGENGEMILKVEQDADLQAQIDAYKEEISKATAQAQGAPQVILTDGD